MSMLLWYSSFEIFAELCFRTNSTLCKNWRVFLLSVFWAWLCKLKVCSAKRNAILAKVQNHLKRPRTIQIELKPSKTTQNNQSKNLIDSSKVFERMSGQEIAILKQKTRPLTGSWSLTLSYNTDIKPLGLCVSESLKQSRNTRSQTFLKIGSLKNFAISTGNTCSGVSFLKSCRPEGLQFYWKGTSTQEFSCEYCKMFKNSIF